MKEEAGITQNSLDNAQELLAKRGNDLARIDFKAIVQNNDYRVILYWMNGTSFTFTGFSWGYLGTGPAGLDEFLALCNIHDFDAASLPIDKFGTTDCSYFPSAFPIQ